MSSNNPPNLSRITFESFKEMAKDPNLSKYEKIGFPDEYRAGKEFDIYKDLEAKLALNRKNITILDIGCGCSDLVDHLSSNAEANNQKLLMLDSQEMLDLISNKPFIEKVPGKFPDCIDSLEPYRGNIDVIIAYSVLHHIILDSNPFSFIDQSLELLNYGGLFLLGDIKNLSKRNRFFASHTGLNFHKEFTKGEDIPPPSATEFPGIYENIDDGMVFGIMQRYRNFGFETYLIPQSATLPFSNRREDLLILKN